MKPPARVYNNGWWVWRLLSEMLHIKYIKANVRINQGQKNLLRPAYPSSPVTVITLSSYCMINGLELANFAASPLCFYVCLFIGECHQHFSPSHTRAWSSPLCPSRLNLLLCVYQSGMHVLNIHGSPVGFKPNEKGQPSTMDQSVCSICL